MMPSATSFTCAWLRLVLFGALLTVDGGLMSAEARGGMVAEDNWNRWNAGHINQLPAEVRNAISSYARACGGPLAAEHSFARYFRSGNANLIGLHFEHLRCADRGLVCKAAGCLHQVYISTNGRYRLLSSAYLPELDLTQVKVAPRHK